MRLCASLLALGWFASCGTNPPIAAPVTPFCSGKVAVDQSGFARRVALTFDDGPRLDVTPRIVEELRRRHIPAAFFLLGSRMTTEPERQLAKDIADDPLFIIGNHSYSHADMGKLDAEAVARDAREMRVILESIGIETRFYRFPYGSASCASFDVLEASGFVQVGWNVDSFDWCFAIGDGRCTQEQSEQMHDDRRDDFLAHVVSSLEQTNGGIVVLHDIHEYTAEQLPTLLDLLIARGFVFVNLDDADTFPHLAMRLATPSSMSSR